MSQPKFDALILAAVGCERTLNADRPSVPVWLNRKSQLTSMLIRRYLNNDQLIIHAGHSFHGTNGAFGFLLDFHRIDSAGERHAATLDNHVDVNIGKTWIRG